jgi:hypothetical protein
MHGARRLLFFVPSVAQCEVSAQPADPEAAFPGALRGPEPAHTKGSIMNRKIALALVALATAAGNALADDITIAPPFTPTLTRAQVQAELQQFRQSGVNPWADEYNQLAQFRGERTRADVRAEYIADRAAVSAFTGEDSGAMYMARREIVRTAKQQLASAPRVGE